MVKDALNWINAALAAWKAIVGIAVFLVLCGAGYAKMHFTAQAATLRDEVQNRRLDNLEKGQDLTHETIVKSLEKLKQAREEVHTAQDKATSEYRKEVRDRMTAQEVATGRLQATLEQIEKRLE